MSDIALFLDQDNELRFNVSIEGSRPGAPKYRLVLEGNDFSYAFRGQQASPGEVAFLIPSMKSILKEGKYRADLEVMIDDRHFVPLSFDALFESSVRVTAESISRPVQKKVGVTATIVSSAQPAARRIVEEAAPPAPRVVEHTASKVNNREFVGEMNGKKITAEDLRRLIREGGI